MSPTEVTQQLIQELTDQGILRLLDPDTKEVMQPTDEGYINLVNHMASIYDNTIKPINDHLALDVVTSQVVAIDPVDI